MSSAAKVLAALRAGAPLDEAWAHVDALVEGRAWREVETLFEALDAWTSPDWVAQAASRRLACVVALADDAEGARVLVRALAGRSEGCWGRAVELAEVLAQGQRVDVLSALLPERDQHVELVARWMHGLVARGCDLSLEASCAVFQDELGERAHVLAGAPLAPSPFERAYRFPRAVKDAVMSASVAPLVHTGDAGALPPVRSCEGVFEPGALFRAVRHWNEATASVVTFTEPVGGAPGPRAFSALPFEPLSGLSLRLQAVPAEAAAARLFSAAAWGGAYGRGDGSAEARVSTAATLGALLGLEGPHDWARLADEAAAARWWLFLGTPWFADVAWDLGLACLRTDHETMVLLASTDTD
ncbi:MAG: DUF6183 family protein [Myxococcaceae bacterium]|nr:DUF6183 family protein [Myxococcaceae bacterium]